MLAAPIQQWKSTSDLSFGNVYCELYELVNYYNQYRLHISKLAPRMRALDEEIKTEHLNITRLFHGQNGPFRLSRQSSLSWYLEQY